jgi:hypothetical protein
LTRPVSGLASAASSRSTLVFPAPLTPTSPTRSPGPSRQGHVVEQPAPAQREVHVLEVEDVLAQSLGREPLQLQPVPRRRFVGDELSGRVHAKRGLLVRAGSTATQPRQLLAHEVLASLLRRRRLPLALGLGEDVRGVAAVVGIDGAIVQLPRRVTDGVEEPPVVRDDDQRARRGGQVPGEPVDRLHVEVVRGLVEDEQVMLAEQQPRQVGAPALTAGHARPPRGRDPCRRSAR